MKRKGFLIFITALLAVIAATIVAIIKNSYMLAFIVLYEIFMLICFFRYCKTFFCSKIFFYFKRFYCKDEAITILLIFSWIVIEFFTILFFAMLNYMLSIFIVLSIVQLALDFILTFGIIPAGIIDFFEK